MSLIQKSVLVLNKFMMATQVSTVQNAIIVLVTGKAKVVDDNYITYNLEGWANHTKELKYNQEETVKYEGLVRSPSIEIYAPQVIYFPDCEYSSPLIKTVKYSRKNIFQRDNYTCQYCSNKFKKEELTLDHIIPKSKGGKSSWTNIVTCCTGCNADKGDKSLKELGWQLKQQPKSPKWKSHVGTPFSMEKNQYWERFLGK